MQASVRRRLHIRLAAIGGMLGNAFISHPAFAATGGTALPWEGPLATIQDSLTGPVATAIAVIALFAAGAALVFGDEMSNFVRRVLVGVMALSLLIFGSHFLTALNLSGSAI